MTDFGKTVSRRTRKAFRIAISGTWPDPAGRRLVVSLITIGGEDLISIREAGRTEKSAVLIDPAEAYRRGLVNMAKAGGG